MTYTEQEVWAAFMHILALIPVNKRTEAEEKFKRGLGKGSDENIGEA